MKAEFKLTVLALVLLAVFTAACRQKVQREEALQKRLRQLSQKAARAEAELEELFMMENEAQDLEFQLKLITGEMEDRNVLSIVRNLVTFQRVVILQLPDYMGESRFEGPLKIGLISLRVQGDWIELMGLVEGVENSSEMAIDRMDIILESLPQETTMNLVIAFPESIAFEESAPVTEEAEIPMMPPEEATPELKIKLLEEALPLFEKHIARKAAVKIRRDELDRAAKSVQNWAEARMRSSDFLRSLPVRWPIGIPSLKKVRVHEGIITFWGYGVIDEVSPFMREFVDELSGLANPFSLNFNPLLKNLDGRNVSMERLDGKIVFAWKGMPVFDLPASDVLSLAFSQENAYIIAPLDHTTEEESLKGDEWKPRPARSIMAISIETREKVWEQLISGSAGATNVILDSTGRPVYGLGKELVFLSPETGSVVEKLSLDGEAVELATGAWGRLIVRIRRDKGKEDWVNVAYPAEQ